MLLRSLVCSVVLGSALPLAAAFEWPEVTPEAKPWTRWWWPGSAVTKVDLTADLEAMAQVGIGGVELTPVYGAKGYEARYLSYLSPEWLEVFDHTLRETRRLGLAIDMANGTGWNFGGPTVGEDDAPKHVVYRQFIVRGGERLSEPVTARQKPFVQYVLNQAYSVSPAASRAADAGAPAGHTGETIASIPLPDVSEIRDPLSANTNLQQLSIDQIKFARDLPLQTLMAYRPGDQTLDLTRQVGPDGALEWTAPAGGEWTLYAVFQAWNGKLVERAGPGGEGYMIDHFSAHATTRYLSHFDRVFAERDLSALRGFFNDSYEVDDARQASDWTDDLLAEFQRRRGYDLREHLPAFFATDGSDEHQRVLMDYRETLSDLLLDRFTHTWATWANRQGKIIRNQAHGSPANILDLYAASDIPETEGISPANIRFASSAAHVSGRQLVGAEAVTFLNENFHSTPAQIRENLRRHWLHGVNHVVYHGTAFAPQDETWPGWFFYVAVHLNPRNPIWAHTSAVHHYAARVQSFLQAGRPDNDVLLYFPIHDRYAQLSDRPRESEGDGPSRRLVEHFTTGWPSLQGTAFGELAAELLTRGYALDYVSDAQLQQVQATGRSVETGDVEYQIVLVPSTRYVPLPTFERLLALAEVGATVAFVGGLPSDVSGWHEHKAKRARLVGLKKQLAFTPSGKPTVQQATHGRGRILLGENLGAVLAAAQVRRESLHDQGLQTIRRQLDDSTVYYLVNPTEQAVDGWVPLAIAGSAAAIYDAATGRIGRAQLRRTGDTASEVYLQIEPQGSRLVRVYSRDNDGPLFPLWRASAAPRALPGPWQVSFLDGGPSLPRPQQIEQLVSWTKFAGDGYEAFSGTAAYTVNFAHPAARASGWWLDLGRVAETAQVVLNGTDLGIVVGPLYRIFVPAELLLPHNTLEVRVANLGANRIADLDRRDPSWKKLYNQNIRPLRAANRGPDGMLRAAHWSPLESGLLGPVTLTPLQPLKVTP